MSTVGDKILQRRKELGLTQEELAKMMGYKSKSTINKIEMGINDIPQSKIVRFAEVLATTPTYLMGWTDEETQKKNDNLMEIIARLKQDEDFANVVGMLDELQPDQFDTIKQLLTTLTKKQLT